MSRNPRFGTLVDADFRKQCHLHDWGDYPQASANS